MPTRSRPDRALLLVLATALLALNTAYLTAYASASVFYFVNVVLHIALGLALAAAFGVLLPRHWIRLSAWQRVAAILLGAGVLFGLAIAVLGAAGRYRWLLPVHIALSLAGGVPLAAAASRHALRQLAGRERAAFATVLAIAGLAAAASVVAATREGAAVRARHRIVNPAHVPATMREEGDGPSGPFFPSSATTNTGGLIPANFFLTSATCGRCHTEIYEEWRSSMHRFSSFNNQWYRKSIEYMQDVVGTHAVEVVRRLPRSRGVLQRPLRSPDQRADRHPGGAGRARLHLVPLHHARAEHDGPGGLRDRIPAAARSRGERATRSLPLRARSADLHRSGAAPRRPSSSRFTREQTPEFCSSCHKVHLDVPVNSYRWFRGFNDYDNWQASGVSGEGARSFYYPPKPQKCADCHMPLVPSKRSGGAERVSPVASLRRRQHRGALRQPGCTCS